MSDVRLVRPVSIIAGACAAASIVVTVILDLDPTDPRLHLLVGALASISLALLLVALVPRSGLRLPLLVAGAATAWIVLMALTRSEPGPAAATIDLTPVLYVALDSVVIGCVLFAARLAPGRDGTDAPSEEQHDPH